MKGFVCLLLSLFMYATPVLTYANTVITPDKNLLTREEFEKQIVSDEGGQLILSQKMTWGEALAKFCPNVRNYSIDKSRKVWVHQAYYPNGFGTKGGFIPNCVVTTISDAQTGEGYAGLYHPLKQGESIPRPK